MAIRWWNVTDSRRKHRYYVESVTGWRIATGGTTRSTEKPSTTYSVFDSANCHEEVARFEPVGGRTTAICKMMADNWCAMLNAAEEAA